MQTWQNVLIATERVTKNQEASRPEKFVQGEFWEERGPKCTF